MNEAATTTDTPNTSGDSGVTSAPMPPIASGQPPGIVFTDAAATKVRELLEDEDNPDLNLRVFIQGGGCSGFQYGFTFDEKFEDGDQAFANGDVKLIVDPMSFQYLMGAEVDYTDSVDGSQFVIRNPNAQTTCGCGSSFSV